ncbi:hypothetical protein MRB53_026299 [Persea americana]|uniref:Uncharacterized protein n=1 Tax=Persea americana TaxID=3435 RepID=A0ACC2LHZ2_PERAE|nr:hypothetical protein MRB53_026299 [Persea americana]
MLSPFLVLQGFSEELCKFWILELTTMLSPFPILRIFEKLWFDLAAMFEFKPFFENFPLIMSLQRCSSSRTNKGKKPVTDAPRRSTRSFNVVVQQAWEEVQYVERNLEEFDGEKRTVSTRSTFDRTISIMSLSSTCSKRKDPPSWVKRTSVIKTGVFVGGPSGFAEKSPARMNILMTTNGYQGSDHPSVDLRPAGLVIFKGDGSNWVKPFRLRGRFSADSSWESWTDHILQVSGAILKRVRDFDVVRAFRQTMVFSDEAFMAMLESFLPQTNTFVVTNG